MDPGHTAGRARRRPASPPGLPSRHRGASGCHRRKAGIASATPAGMMEMGGIRDLIYSIRYLSGNWSSRALDRWQSIDGPSPFLMVGVGSPRPEPPGDIEQAVRRRARAEAVFDARE